MNLLEVRPSDFDWTDEAGPAGVVRRIAAAADAHDLVANLNEAALLALQHEGVDGARLILADEAGFALQRGTDLDLVVAPSSRGDGVGTALLNALVAEYDGELQVWSHADHPAAGALARAFDFGRIRDLWVMGRPLDDTVPVRMPTSGVTVRPFVTDDLADVVEVNRQAFADHPEQGSLTDSDFAQRMAEPWFDPEGLLVAEIDGRIAGFHWTKVHPDGTGEVYVVGVLPDAAGRGIGATVTSAGLQHLRRQGCAQVILYVDADNHAAVSLYRRLGFTRTRGEAQYRRSARH